MRAQFSLPDIVRPALAFTPTGPAPGRRPHSWDGEPVAAFSCRFRDIGDLLPTFRRTPFLAATLAGVPACESVAVNPHLDVIVRHPDRFRPVPFPVGTVSKRYELVQHVDAMHAVGRALATRRIAPDCLPVEVVISESGRHLACSVRLPEKFDFTEADGTRMALTIECFNSVDGSSAFRVLAGWFRFV